MIQPSFEVVNSVSHQSYLLRIFEEEAFTSPYHYHPEFELTLITQGSGKRYIGNHMANFDEGDLVFLGGNLPHCWKTDPVNKGMINAGSIVIQFTHDFLGTTFFDKPEMLTIKKLFERSQQGIVFYGHTKSIICNKLKKLLHLSHFERLLELILIFQMLAKSDEYELLNSADTRYDFNQKDQVRLKRIYEYVEQNYQNPIEMKAVANLANLTIPSFCNYFKKTVNQTFTDFMNEYRINQACKLLITEKSITDICFDCGFANASYFSKVFKQIKGKSPLQFKNLVLRK